MRPTEPSSLGRKSSPAGERRSRRKMAAAVIILSVLVAIGGFVALLPRPPELWLRDVAFAPGDTEALVIGDSDAVGILAKFSGGEFTVLQRIEGRYPYLADVDWSVDRLALVVGNVDGKAFARLYDGSAVRSVTVPDNRFALDVVKWSPQGDRALAAGGGGVVYEYNRTQDAFRSIPLPWLSHIWSIAWAPNGTEALLVGQPGAVYRYRQENGDVLRLTSIDTRVEFFDVAWNAAGTTALIAGAEGIVLRYDGATLQTVGIIPPRRSGDALDLHDVEWSPNGSSALITGAERKIVPTHNTGEYAPIVAEYDASTGALSTDSTPLQFSPGQGSPSRIAWASDGRIFVTSGTSLYRWSPAGLSRVYQAQSPLYAVSISSSNLVMFCGTESRVYALRDSNLVEDLTPRLMGALGG